jgi:hypothetical protein
VTGSLLREHWRQAIRFADGALEAAVRAESISVDEASRHRRVLASEHAWLDAFQWAKLRPST